MSLKNLGLAALLLARRAARPRAQTQTVRIGVTPGPHAQILEAVKPIAAKKGLDIKIVEFSDYVVPNAALAAGDIEANSFQHQPYLDNQMDDRGFKIESVGADRELPDRASTRRRSRAWTSCRTAPRSRSRTIRPMAAARCCCCRTRA